jgi:hypothetical protein
MVSASILMAGALRARVFASKSMDGTSNREVKTTIFPVGASIWMAGATIGRLGASSREVAASIWEVNASNL